MSMDPHDQTRGDSTPFFADDQPAPLSCNEAMSLCLKAARGAGMDWGMAEEAGFAAAWLVSLGIDGPTYLRAHLERAEGKDWNDLCPVVTPTTWRSAKDQTVCPIILGATLCDYAGLPEGLQPNACIALGCVSAPILLIPFLAELALERNLTITLAWADGSICIEDDMASFGTASELLSTLQLDLKVSAKPAQQPFKTDARPTANAHTTAATIAALNNFAMRTTVPASDASRARAGSTLSDND